MNQTGEVVVAGHICLDIIPRLPDCGGRLDTLLVPGKLVDAGTALTATGGAVANTGLALHRLGLKTRLVGKVGDDLFGEAIRSVLRSHGPELADHMLLAPGEASSYTIVINPPGVDRIFLHCPGANDTFAAADLPDRTLAGARLAHFGYPPLMRRCFENEGRELEKILGRLRSGGATLSLDLARPDPASPAGLAPWPAILRRALPLVDVFLPSLDELLYIYDRPRFDRLAADPAGEAGKLSRAELRALADRLLAAGAAMVAIKLGERGLYLRTTADPERLARMGAAAPADRKAWLDRELHATCFKVQVAGTTGAGDCTIAGFLAGLLMNLAPEAVMDTAVGVGACCVERPDAVSGIRPWAEVQARLKTDWPRLKIGLD